jgi:putative addiction module component (TIGR02574 family)
MEISPDIIGQVFSLTPQDRYELAQHLLDSIDDAAAADLDRTFVAELRRRRDEMLNGNETVIDWRASLSTIENQL